MSFSKKVLELTKQIPKGKITTYRQLAAAAGNEKASRAAGSALNKNKHPTIIPCHRVIKSTGEAGGYSRGKEKKIALLKKEGILIKGETVINHKHYLHKFKNKMF